MKQLFAVLALAGVLASCNNKKNEEKKPDETTSKTTSTTTTSSEGTTSPMPGVPKFKDPDVQQYANEYAAFITSYIDAFKAKDNTKIATLDKEMEVWSSKAVSIAQKMIGNDTDAAKFSEFENKLVEQLNAAMQMK